MVKRNRSMLFCPANNTKFLESAHTRGSDSIIFDLEDAIAIDEKDEARRMLCESLQTVDRGDCQVFARINGLDTPFGIDDVKALVKAGIKNIRLPMCESKEDIIRCSNLLKEEEEKNNIPVGTVKIQCSIETPKGVLNAIEIAGRDERVISISFGTEDYTNSLGTDRTDDLQQFLYAKSHLALAASMAGVYAIDTVYSNFRNTEHFEIETKQAKLLGFAGKSCIHPAQIEIANKIFAPTDEEIEEAKLVISTAKEAEEKGLGVVSLNGKMIDKPIIEKAEKILIAAGMTN